MAEITIYHNPRCSKSRATLQLLTEAGVTPKIVKYLETPPTVEELDAVLTALNLEPEAIIRKGESAYKALSVEPQKLGRQALLQLLVDNPILIERPIVVKGNQAVIGRPPDTVLSLIK